VSVSVRALKGKRLELSTKLGTHVLMAMARHVLTQSSKVKGQCHTVTKTVTVAWLLVCCCGHVLLLTAWDAHVIWVLWFLV